MRRIIKNMLRWWYGSGANPKPDIRPVVHDILWSIREEPEQWKSDSHRLYNLHRRCCLWISNGDYSLHDNDDWPFEERWPEPLVHRKLKRPLMFGPYSKDERRAIWEAFLKRQRHVRLPGMKDLEKAAEILKANMSVGD